MANRRRVKRKNFEKGLLKRNQAYLVLDTETGGLDAKENALIELSYAIILNGAIPVRRQLLMRDGKQISDKALEVNGYIREQIREYESAESAAVRFLGDITRIVDPFDISETVIPVGHNISFDMRFVKEWMYDADMAEFFEFIFEKPLDTLSLAREAKSNGWIETDDAKLETVADYFGVLREGAHVARIDVEMTIDVLERLLRLKKENTVEVKV